jgi:hypothetical protein
VSRGGALLAGLPDDLVGLEEERRGNGQAQGLDGLEGDDQVALYGLLHSQLSGLGACEALVDAGCRAPAILPKADPLERFSLELTGVPRSLTWYGELCG